MALQPRFDLRFLLDCLEKRPQMMGVANDYDSIVDYLYGFEAGCIHSDKKSPLDEFREFLLARVENCQSYGWRTIVQIMAQRDGKNSQTLLFQLLKEFLRIPADYSWEFE